MPSFTSPTNRTFGDILASRYASFKKLSDLQSRSATQDAYPADYVRLAADDGPGRMSGALDFVNTTPVAAVIHQGKIVMMSCLSSDSHYVFGTLGEDTDHCRPAKIPMTEFGGTFVTVISYDDAVSGGFPMLDAMPLTCTNKAAQHPEPDDGDETKAEDQETQHTPDSLHWTITRDGDMPRFVVMPNFCPLPKGFRLLPDVSLTGAQAWDHDTPPHFAAWCKGARWLHAHCNGHSCQSANNPLFYPTGVILPTPPFNLRDRLDVNLTGVDSITDPGRFATAQATHYLRVREYRLEKAEGTAFVPEDFDTPDAGTGRREASPGNITVSTITASSEEAAAEKLAKHPVTLQLRILLAHEGTNPAGEPALILPPIGNVVGKILTAKSASEAASTVQPDIRDYISTTRDTGHSIDQRITMQPELFDASFCGALRQFSFLRKPLNTSCNHLGYLISLLNFGSVKVDSESYMSRLTTAHEADSEERVGIDSKQAAKPNSKLYYNVDLANAEHFHELLANFYLFLRCADGALDDSIMDLRTRDEPALWKIAFAPILLQFSIDSGRVWGRSMSDQPAVWLNLVTEMHSVILSALAVADDLQIRRTAARDGWIPSSAFAQVRGMASIVQTKLVSAMLHGTNDGYQYHSQLYLKLNPGELRKRDNAGPPGQSTKKGRTSFNTANTTPTNAAGNASTGTGSHNTNTSASAGQRTPLTEAERKKKGLFKWTGAGKIPDCTVLYPHHKKQETMALMCKDFCFVGRCCKRPNCVFAHIFRKSQLKPEKLQATEGYVSTHEGLEWANPQEPPPTSSATSGSE